MYPKFAKIAPMGVAKLRTKTSVEDYLKAEEISPVKHEYVDGEVYAMAGTSDRHNLIAGDLYALLLARLKDSECQPFFGEIKVQVSRSVVYYPDLLVTCEEEVESPYFRNNPKLIVEVTSPSTRQIDRREKLLFYLQMPSVQEYVIVEQHKMSVEVHRRQTNGGWITHFFNEPSDVVELQSVDLSFPLPDIYRRVKLDKNAAVYDDEQ